MSELLPPSATLAERALEGAVSRLSSVPVPVGQVWDPATCPAGVLPWLAWALSVDDWDASWSEAQKRAAIAASIQVHRRKGTVGAVRRALQALGYEVEIDENTGTAYTFGVLVDTAALNLSEADYERAERAALVAKNVRSHLASMRPTLRACAPIVVAGVCYDGEDTTVMPFFPGEQVLEGVAYAAGFVTVEMEIAI